MLVLGMTFKENIPDIRNSKVVDLIIALKTFGNVHVHDPFINSKNAPEQYDFSFVETLNETEQYDAIIGAVCHDLYCDFAVNDLQKLLKPSGFVADIKGMWRNLSWPSNITYWTM